MHEYKVFVVRVWRQLSEFRASVRSADDGPPQVFTRPEQVGDFLRDAAVVSADGSGSANATQPGSRSRS